MVSIAVVAHRADQIDRRFLRIGHRVPQRAECREIDGLFGAGDGRDDGRRLAAPRDLDALASFDAVDDRTQMRLGFGEADAVHRAGPD